MDPRLIDHVGILVPDLETAIERWERVLGYSFSPIVRYRTDRWVDSSDPNPHFHDVRVVKSKNGPPQVEIMEITGGGTHSATETGFHHICFRGVEDLEGRIEELAAEGIATNGCAFNEDGRVILFFNEKEDFDGIRMEYAASVPQPVVADDGSETSIRIASGAPGWTSR